MAFQTPPEPKNPVDGSVMVSLLLYMYIELRDKIDKILKDDKE